MFLIAFSINLYSADSGKDSVFSLLNNNKIFIKDVCENCTYEPDGRRYKNPACEQILNATKLSSKESICENFISICRKLSPCSANNSTIINNDIFVKILIAFLNDEQLPNRCKENIYDLLVSKTSYSLLPNYKKNFIAILEKDSALTEKELKLFALLAPNQIEKERILQNKNVSLCVRIRLGDTTVIPDLISRYEHENNFYRKSIICREIIYTGNKDCVKYFLANFNKLPFDTIIKGRDTCYAESMRYSVITALKPFFAEDTLLNAGFNRVKDPTAKEQLITIYFQNFTIWAKDNFAVIINGPLPKPILRGICMK
jgi:hypothetical protein